MLINEQLDKLLYEGLDHESRLKMKTVELTIEFLKDRPANKGDKFEAFNDVFERIYKSLKNDTDKQNVS